MPDGSQCWAPTPNCVKDQLGVIRFWLLVSGVSAAAGQKTASLIEKETKCGFTQDLKGAKSSNKTASLFN
jgi:hypothetical protein